MPNNNISVTKINGEIAPFDEDKIRRSAARVGVPENLQDELLEHIRSKIYDRIPTKEIFHEIKSFLQSRDKPRLSTIFNLKSAILQLGPSGYPFEKYIAELLEEEGYSTSTNGHIPGKCVTHEIDVLATKDNTTSLIEAKFHSKQAVKTDVKVVLYIRARFQDVENGWTKDTTIIPWIITNAKFTSDAIKYGDCTSVKLTSWDYPDKFSLRELIERHTLHPVTILDTASQKNKRLLLENGIVTCRQFLENNKNLASYIPVEDLSRMTEEASRVCSLD